MRFKALTAMLLNIVGPCRLVNSYQHLVGYSASVLNLKQSVSTQSDVGNKA